MLSSSRREAGVRPVVVVHRTVLLGGPAVQERQSQRLQRRRWQLAGADEAHDDPGGRANVALRAKAVDKGAVSDT